MTPARFRKLALSFEGVEERPHMDRTAFRTTRKIFATLGQDKRVNLMIQPAERRDALLASYPDVFFSLGGWSRLGYLAVELAQVEEALLRELLTDAWSDARPAPKARAASAPAKKTRARR